MDKQDLINCLTSKPDIDALAAAAVQNKALLNSMFDIVATQRTSACYGCIKVICRVSQTKPELIYPYFDTCAGWLYHPNSFIKWDAIAILSNLVQVDRDNKFVPIYQPYFDLIGDTHMITASNVIKNAWKIALAMPNAEDDITRRLLGVPGNIYLHKGSPSAECNRIACGHVLQCFDYYFYCSGSQPQMLAFAQSQLDSQCKLVARAARRFLNKYGR